MGAPAPLAGLYTRQPLPPLPEYLPQDNIEEGAAVCVGDEGEAVLRLQAKSLRALLALRQPAVFVRWVLGNINVRPSIDLDCQFEGMPRT